MAKAGPESKCPLPVIRIVWARARDPLPICPANRRLAEYQERTPPLAKATGPTFGDARLLLLFHS